METTAVEHALDHLNRIVTGVEQRDYLFGEIRFHLFLTPSTTGASTRWLEPSTRAAWGDEAEDYPTWLRRMRSLLNSRRET
jgi:hypothetical protein